MLFDKKHRFYSQLVQNGVHYKVKLKAFHAFEREKGLEIGLILSAKY